MPDHKELTQDELEEVYVQWKVGMSMPELADQYGVSRSKMARELQIYRAGLNGEEDIVPRQGLKSGPIELSFDDETMEGIYEEFAEGFSLSELSKKYGKVQSVISHNIKLWEALLDPEDRITPEQRKEREAKVRARAKEQRRQEIRKAAQKALESLQQKRGKKK